MALVRLILTDVDVDTGEVAISSEIEGSLVDDGQMTAAELMARCLIEEINSDQFRSKMWRMVEDMIANKADIKFRNPAFNPNNKAA
jgi:hypothetical protein